MQRYTVVDAINTEQKCKDYNVLRHKHGHKMISHNTAFIKRMKGIFFLIIFSEMTGSVQSIIHTGIECCQKPLFSSYEYFDEQ